MEEKKQNEYYPAMSGSGAQYTAQYAAAKPSAPEKIPVEREDLIISAVLVALTLFAVAAGLWGGFRLGYTAAFIAVFAALSVYLGRRKQKPGVFGCVCGALALAMSPVFVVTSNVVVRGGCLLGGAILSAIWFDALSGRRAEGNDLGLVRLLADNFAESLGNIPLTLRSVFSPKNPRMKGVSKALLGVVCAVPVLCAVVPLLIRSDAAFDGLIGSLFSNLGSVAAQVVITLLISPVLLSFAVSLRRTDGKPMPVRTGKGLDTAFLAAFLSVLSAVYVVYLGSQLAYFFDAFKGILPAGQISYAEYARRGFFELCAVAGINLVILFTAVLVSRKKEGKLPAALRGLGVFITLFTLVIIGTAIAKMALYIDNYGMTVLRLGTSAFMVFMAVVFVAVGLRLFTPRVRVLQVAAVTAAAVLLVLGLGNINEVVAKYNYNAYVTGKLETVDVEYLAQLGTEGVPYLVKLTDREAETSRRRQTAERLFYLYTEYYECDFNYVDDSPDYEFEYTFETPMKRTFHKLSQFNLPQKACYDALEDFLADYPDFLEKEGRALAMASAGKENVRYYFDPPTTAPPVNATEREK